MTDEPTSERRKTRATRKRQPKAEVAPERPATLLFWWRDGMLSTYDARVPADTEVSIGRAGSKRALGFMITRGRKAMDFVLDKDQVAELAAFLRLSHARLLKPRGKPKRQLSPAASEMMWARRRKR